MKNTTRTDDEIIILAADFREAQTSCGVTCDVFDAVGFARAILAASEQRIAELEKDAARLQDAAEGMVEVLDAYPEQLVPINRESATVRRLRDAVKNDA